MLRRFALPAAFTIAALGAGLAGGTATVRGMETSRYGMTAPPLVPASDDSATSIACDGCSEHDLGYRWAMARQVASSTDCPNDSWDFRRGCVDYMRGLTGA